MRRAWCTMPGCGRRRPLLEISGGITLENAASYARTGADMISSGSLTNSAPVLDIGLDIRTRARAAPAEREAGPERPRQSGKQGPSGPGRAKSRARAAPGAGD